MRLKAIIFDVDGTLAETERDGHLPACNEAFATLGFPVRWTWPEWKALLSVPNSSRRMRLALQELDPPLLPHELDAGVATLARLKRRLYAEKTSRGCVYAPAFGR
jgi:putative hydrolase of the HAD superfamily